MHATISSAKYF